MRAAVVYKTDGLVKRVEEALKRLEVEASFFTQPSEELENFDFIVSVGGDGTILRILQKLKRCPPIFGINTGRVGLLTHASPENFEEELRKAVEKFEVGLLTHASPENFEEELRKAVENFEVEKFPRICCSAMKDVLALNEIAVLSRRPAKMIDVSVKVDGVDVERIRCDGFVVATQIGSTGYAFSAGGPVVEPYLECFVLTPIAPFRFGWKPYVVSMDRKIEIEAENAILVADGQKSVDFDRAAIVEKSEFPAVFFKNENRFRNLFGKVKSIG